MGAASAPDPAGLAAGMSGPTIKGQGSDVTTKAWRASNGSTVSKVAVLVDGPND
jgi:hypothetical protein